MVGDGCTVGTGRWRLTWEDGVVIGLEVWPDQVEGESEGEAFGYIVLGRARGIMDEVGFGD